MRLFLKEASIHINRLCVKLADLTPAAWHHPILWAFEQRTEEGGVSSVWPGTAVFCYPLSAEPSQHLRSPGVMFTTLPATPCLCYFSQTPELVQSWIRQGPSERLNKLCTNLKFVFLSEMGKSRILFHKSLNVQNIMQDIPRYKRH